MTPSFDKLPRAQLVLIASVLFTALSGIVTMWAIGINDRVRTVEIESATARTQMVNMDAKLSSIDKKLDTILYKGLKLQAITGGDGDI